MRVRERTAESARAIETLQDEVRRRRQAAERLRAASLHSRNLIDASLDSLATIDSEGRTGNVDKAFEEATGVPLSRLIGGASADCFTEPQ